MAIQSTQSFLMPYQTGFKSYTFGCNNFLIDAAGESFFCVGRVVLPGGPGTSKTISSSGGSVAWRAGTTTFANAGTTLRIGIQDLNTATGIEDGTFDVYKDLVGGTDTITAFVLTETAMATGSKTINHNDWIAIGMEVQSRGGSDAFRICTYYNLWSDDSAATYPTTAYMTYDSGSGPVKSNPNIGVGSFALTFDDGTIGWIRGAEFPPLRSGGGSVNINTASNPDEIGVILNFPGKVQFGGGGFVFGSGSGNGTFEYNLYSSPFGTPSLEASVTITDAEMNNTQTGLVTGMFSSPVTLQPDTDYAFVARPTTTTAINFYYDVLANTKWKPILGFPNDVVQRVGRQNQTGAFSVIDSTHYIDTWMYISGIDDGVSAGTPYII